jgi:hypothetical protein
MILRNRQHEGGRVFFGQRVLGNLQRLYPLVMLAEPICARRRGEILDLIAISIHRFKGSLGDSPLARTGRLNH